MGDLLLKCPLCCSEVFHSREMLVHHLSKVWLNLRCPVCNDECSSISHMLDHLNQSNCVPKPKKTEVVTSGPIVSAAIHNIAEGTPTLAHHNVTENQADQMLNQSQDVSDINRMYVELLNKQLTKPCLQTQELKLVKEDGESRYVIVTQEDTMLNSGSTVFTKQNSDGTISLTTVKDMKLEAADPDPLMPENEPEESQEIYSCNTCGVSFSSVIEHIQNYHNDQEVVVEESLDSCQLPMEYEQMNGEDVTTGELQQSRRVITDTGDIVEAPVLLNATLDDSHLSMEPLTTDLLVERKSKPPRPVAMVEKKMVQVDSVVTNLKQKEDIKKGPYHKVIVKEMQMLEGGKKVKVYNCMTCNIYVTSLDEFKSQPCKPQKFQCPHCSVAYENSKSLSAHMKIHKAHEETDSTGPFKCDICSTIFPSNKSLKLHKRMHDPVKARPIELPVESEGTETSNNKYICSICDKLIPIDYRAVHNNSHNTDNKYNCDICNRKFHSSEYLEMHMSVHNLDKAPVNKQDKSLPYNCSYCTRQFARPHEKVKHERIHTGEKPHSCEICGKSFRVSYCLTLHMRTHTGARPYACPHCNKRFKAHSVYNHHLLTHSEVRAYKCPYCPKAFKTSVQLAGHKNSHTKPFSCQHCNRPFASLYAVRAHTETHARQNNLKFACTLCGASYARTFALKDHIKQVHNKELDAVNKTTVDLKEEGWILSEGDIQGMDGRQDVDDMQVSLDKSVPNEINQLVINTNEAESVMIYGSPK